MQILLITKSDSVTFVLLNLADMCHQILHSIFKTGGFELCSFDEYFQIVEDPSGQEFLLDD